MGRETVLMAELVWPCAGSSVWPVALASKHAHNNQTPFIAAPWSVVLTTRRAQSAATGIFGGNIGSVVTYSALTFTTTRFVYETGTCLQNGGASRQGRKPHYGTTAEDRMDFRGGFWPPMLTSIGTESVTCALSHGADDRCWRGYQGWGGRFSWLWGSLLG